MILTRIDAADLEIESTELAPLFDPQTGGGMLLGAAEDQVDAILEFLRQNGASESAVIGTVLSKSDAAKLSLESS